jgi:glycosyltransferase involved in cell wall biosynthesis
MGKARTRHQARQKELKLSLVIPAHNSAEIIQKSIISYSKFLASFCREYEIIVVCNACTDSTEQLAGKTAEKDRHVRILSMRDRGKGYAILKGFKSAKYSIIGFMDADCVFDLGSVKKMLGQLDDYDCVIASKWLDRNVFSIPEPFTRKILAVGWKAATIFLFHIRFHDTQAGCKFMKKKAFNAIDKKFICTGFDFDVELLYKLTREGFKIKECYIPIVNNAPFSTFRLKYLSVI